MPVVETECIVLRTYDLADADKIAVLLTADHGLIRAVAKGVKRLKSKFGSALEPLTRANAFYFQKETRELVDLDRIDVLESSFDLASDPAILTSFAYLTDILIALVPAEDPDPAIFRMMHASLSTVRAEPRSVAAVSMYFESWLLRLAGFFPAWYSCSLCGSELDARSDAQVGGEFQLVCSRCSKTSGGTWLTADERQIVEMTRRLSPANFASEELNLESLAKLSTVFKRMIARASGIEKIDRALKAGVNSQN